jgi:hypothetical protein
VKEATPIQTCECDNCEWTGPIDKLRCQLPDIENLFERLDVGSEVPAGECPKCGALAYLKTDDLILTPDLLKS